MTVSIVVRAVVEGKRPQTSQGKGRERNVLRTLAATTLQYRSRPVIMPSSRGSEILETTISAPISWVFQKLRGAPYRLPRRAVSHSLW